MERLIGRRTTDVIRPSSGLPTVLETGEDYPVGGWGAWLAIERWWTAEYLETRYATERQNVSSSLAVA